MNPYVTLGAAILSELLGTTSLKLSQGLSRPLPTLGVLVGYGAAFYLVSLTLDELPIGVVAFDERIDLAGVVGIGLIVAGVYCVNVVSDMAAR